MDNDATDKRGTIKGGPGTHVAFFALSALAHASGVALCLLFREDLSLLSMFWIPSGVLVGLLVRVPVRNWSPVLLGAVAGSAPAHTLFGLGTGVSVQLALVHALSGALGASALRWSAGAAFSFASLHQTAFFMLVPASLVPFLTGLPAALILTHGGAPFVGSWLVWSLATSLGVLAVTPLFLTFGRPDNPRPPGRRQRIEIILLTGLAVLAALWVFSGIAPPDMPLPPKLYMIMPLVLWCALRFEQRGAAVASFGLALVSAFFTAYDRGPFSVSGSSPTQHMAALHLFLAISIITALAFAAVLAQRRHALRLVTESEELYREAIAAANAVVYRRAYNRSRYDYVSPGVHQLLGIEPWQFTTGTLDGLIEEATMRGEAEGLTHEQAVARAVAGGITRWQADYRVRTPDGRTVWLADSSVQVTDPATGRSFASLGILQDITARMEAEAALRESEARFRTLADCAPILIWMSDPSGWCTFVSRPGLNHTGLEQEEFLGNRWKHRLHPAERHALLRAMRGAFALRDVFDRELRFRFADGGYRWLLCGGAPRFSRSGAFAGYVGSCIDITERKAAETRKQRLTDYLTAVSRVTSLLLTSRNPLHAIPQVLEILGTAAGASRCYRFENHRSPDGTRLLCSIREEWHVSTGVVPRTPEDLHDLDYDMLMPDSAGILARGDVISLSASEMPHNLEVLLEPYAIRALLIIPMFVSNRFAGCIGFDDCVGGRAWGTEEVNLLRAATDSLSHAFERHHSEELRLKLEAEIQHAQKTESLGVLAGGIAHDFNNLLVAILGNAGLAMEDIDPSSPAHETVRDIETAARRAADLTRQMLAYSGKGKFVMQRIDLNAMVREMAQLLEISVSKKADLRFDLLPEPPCVEGDETQLRQILMNLIINASEALDGHRGTVTVRTGVRSCDRAYLESAFGGEALRPGEYAYFEVADNGRGMDAETLARIFEPFFTTKFTGRGLGLAAAQGIIRSHNGALRVSSRVGEGSRFRVLLPLCEAAPETPPATPSRGVDTVVVNGSGTVLVADDEASVRGFAGRLLRRMGFDVITASDGREAVELFQREAPNIRFVLLDMTMPHLNGGEVLRMIRKIRPEIRVILSSGFSEQEATHGLGDDGISGFLQKPYRPAQFTETVARILQ